MNRSNQIGQDSSATVDPQEDFTSRTTAGGLLRFERSHIDGEAVLHIGLEESVVGLVDLLDRDDFDIGSDVMGPAKFEHLLGFGDTANGRAGETTAPHDESKGRHTQGLLRCANKGDVAVATEQVHIGVDVVIGGDSIEDEVEATSVLLHLLAVAGNDDFVGPEAERVFFLAG